MQDIGLPRETITRYLSVLERLFLIRTLPAWHRNAAKRLVKAPKIHIVDSGLGSALTGLVTAGWNKPDNAFGGMLESFVVQQLICQSGWCDLRRADEPTMGKRLGLRNRTRKKPRRCRGQPSSVESGTVDSVTRSSKQQTFGR